MDLKYGKMANKVYRQEYRYVLCVCVCDILFENSFWQVALSVISVSITCMCS